MNLFLVIVAVTFVLSFCEVQEEFHAHGPLEFHDIAMKVKHISVFLIQDL